MAYDEELADRLREELAGTAAVTERRMFGGLAFLVRGHLAVAASGHGGLMVRCVPEQRDELLARPYAAPMVMRGRDTAGWLRVAPAGVADDADLRAWVAVGLDAVRGLPPRG
ncbi:TfoX/Sxy family protein [Angustibacter aerolatus]